MNFEKKLKRGVKRAQIHIQKKEVGSIFFGLDQFRWTNVIEHTSKYSSKLPLRN